MKAMPNGQFTVKEPTAPEQIPVGIYDARFVSWEEKEGNKGNYVRLEFAITKGEYTDTLRSLLAGSKLTKGKTQETTSKLFRTITGLLGREPKPNENISLDDLVGTDCKILVENKPGSEEGWQDITKVMPAKQ